MQLCILILPSTPDPGRLELSQLELCEIEDSLCSMLQHVRASRRNHLGKRLSRRYARILLTVFVCLICQITD